MVTPPKALLEDYTNRASASVRTIALRWCRMPSPRPARTASPHHSPPFEAPRLWRLRPGSDHEEHPDHRLRRGTDPQQGFARARGPLPKEGCIWVFRLNRRWSRDAGVGGNVARFINHACKPNCWHEVVDNTIWIRASRRIEPGEELTYDYGTVGDKIIPCLCRPGCKTEVVREGSGGVDGARTRDLWRDRPAF